MAITLDGTSGITTPDITSDSYTGPLNVDASAPDNSLVVDSSGNVGIGTTSPSTGYGGTITNVKLALKNNGAGGNNGTSTLLLGGDNNHYSYLSAEHTGGGSTYLAFGTASGANNPTERARISEIGNLLVGLTTNVFNSRLAVESNGAAVTPFSLSDSSAGPASHYLATWYRAGSLTGSITVTGTTTAYNTSSDYRLKEDWQPMTGASERVQALKPVNFAWKVDGSRVDGFLAHEAQEVVPECVFGVKDATEIVDIKDEDGNVTGQEERPVYQGIDQSKLVPLLTAALQEALTKIDALTARIEALEQA